MKVRAFLTCIACLGGASGALAADPWAVPAEGSCRQSPPIQLDGEDAPAGFPLPGETLTIEQVERLKIFLPPELWLHRERFFFDGMRMEIGPCHRDYAAPEFYTRATRELSSGVTLDGEGHLEGYRAGLPFPPASIAADDPKAALRWAWNWVSRYVAAGAFGEHRLSIVNDRGVAEQWRGDHFFARLLGRAELPEQGYRQETKIEATWAAGGSTRNLQTGSVCAFRQYGQADRQPDYFVGSSGMRKIKRQPGPDTESPLTACLSDATIGAGLFVHGAQPALHDWKVRAVVDLFAPINTRTDTWPGVKDRSYGPWGISFADDRWELRRVLVLEGRRKEGSFEDGTTSFVRYLDLQTLAPLYYAGYRADGEVAGIGYYVYRWSEDRPDYPRWPDDGERPLRTLDAVGAAFVSWNDTHAVRIEMGDQVGVPASESGLNRQLSISSVRIR